MIAQNHSPGFTTVETFVLLIFRGIRGLLIRSIVRLTENRSNSLKLHVSLHGESGNKTNVVSRAIDQINKTVHTHYYRVSERADSKANWVLLLSNSRQNALFTLCSCQESI